MTQEKEQMVAIARMMESGIKTEFWQYIKNEISNLIAMYDAVFDGRDDTQLARASEGRRVAKQIIALPDLIIKNTEQLLNEENIEA